MNDILRECENPSIKNGLLLENPRCSIEKITVK